jgi:hypothetical protein
VICWTDYRQSNQRKSARGGPARKSPRLLELPLPDVVGPPSRPPPGLIRTILEARAFPSCGECGTWTPTRTRQTRTAALCACTLEAQFKHILSTPSGSARCSKSVSESRAVTAAGSPSSISVSAVPTLDLTRGVPPTQPRMGYRPGLTMLASLEVMSQLGVECGIESVRVKRKRVG